jgi:ABC-2 type transport system permease protein
MRYIRLWWTFFKNCLTREMEYRGHMIAQVMIDVAWYGVQLALFNVIYQYTPSVGGLSHPEMLVFLATLFIIDAINMILVSTNFWRFPWYVASGELDFYIMRPINTFFFAFFRYPSIASVFNLFLGLSLLAYSLPQIHVPDPALALVLYPLLIICGFLVMFAFQTMVTALSVFLVGADGIQMVFHTLHQFGTKPDQIYSGFMRRFLIYIFPMAITASIPARVLYGDISLHMILWSVGITAVLTVAAVQFFYWALKHYSGASA